MDLLMQIRQPAQICFVSKTFRSSFSWATNVPFRKNAKIYWNVSQTKAANLIYHPKIEGLAWSIEKRREETSISNHHPIIRAKYTLLPASRYIIVWLPQPNHNHWGLPRMDEDHLRGLIILAGTNPSLEDMSQTISFKPSFTKIAMDTSRSRVHWKDGVFSAQHNWPEDFRPKIRA